MTRNVCSLQNPEMRISVLFRSQVQDITVNEWSEQTMGMLKNGKIWQG